MNAKKTNMKKIILSLMLSIILLGCAYGQGDIVEINGVNFEIPNEYLGGEIEDDKYQLDNIFSIRCVDDDLAKAIGLWDVENDFSKDLKIGKHPVRHYCQYNNYVKDNQSHLYFMSGESFYEITWTGNEITKDITKLIKDSPDSKMVEDTFYNQLNKSVNEYKLEKIDTLNQESQYNYLEAKYQSQYNQQKTPDDTRFKEILLTYYNK